MDVRRLSCAALVLGVAGLAGCISPFKPETVTQPPKAVEVNAAAPAPPPPAPTTPSADDQMGRLRAFVTGDGLATTPANPGQGARLTAAWQNKVIYAPDPTHGGNPVPGLMGKMWVFGPDEGVPLSLDGEIFVGAWDNSRTVHGGEPVLLEVWHLDPAAAKKVRRAGFMGGEEYYLFLPWSQYHVDLKQINVVARFNGADGRSLVSAPETLTLDHSTTLQRAAERLGGLPNGAPARPTAAGPQVPINFPEAPKK